jgi:probable HAF family extracellular repeat protein
MIKATARLGLLGAALMLGGLAAAPAYAATEPTSVPAPKQLGTLGGKNSIAIDINDRGQVVGQSGVDPNSTDLDHVFLWQRGVMKDLGTGFTPKDLNNKGHIAVTFIGNNGFRRAGLWRDGKIVDLGTPDYSDAYAVNDNDEVVGAFTNKEGQLRAFVWRRGVITELPGENAGAHGINNKGVIVGLTLVGGTSYRGVVWRNGKLTELGGGFEDAVAVNDDGVIIGNGGRPLNHGVSWKNGTTTRLRPLATSGTWSDYTFAKAINNRGEIIGQSANTTGEESAIWRHGKPRGGLGGRASGINNRGQLVGFTFESPDQHEFIYKAAIWG